MYLCSCLKKLTISYHCYPRLNHIVDTLWLLSQDHFPTESSVLRIARSNFNVATNVPRHEHFVVGLYLFSNGPYPLQCEIPLTLGEAHGITAVFHTNIEQDLPMTLCQTFLNVLS